MLVHEWLSRSAAAAPDRIAVVEPGGEATYGEVDRRATEIAAALTGSGVAPGDRVVLALPNSAEWVAAYFGILRAGAVAVPLQPGPRNDRLPKVVQDCAPAACIVDDSTWPAIAEIVLATVPARFVVPRQAAAPVPEGTSALPRTGAAAAPPPAAPPARTAADLAAIIYTSGSTGAPRGVMLSHGNLAANTASIVEYLALTAADRVMVVLPFYYVYGLSLLHTHVAVGGSLVIDNRFAFPNAVVQAMARHAVTGFAGVPSTFALLLHKSNIARVPLPALRYVTQAGGPMPPARIDEWLATVPDVPFVVMYGATEASARLTFLPPRELRRRPGSIGHAIPGVVVRVCREDGSDAAAGEVGELVASGANIASGYWNCPDETAERFGAAGFRTGDLGYRDADGFLYLVGRRTEMLKIGGNRVSAREIEEALHEHPAVHEVAVVGAPDEILGEVAVAYVVLRPGDETGASDLLAFARARLPEHKVPARFTLMDELPKTPAGKPDKRALEGAGAAAQPASQAV
jgi:amino acid adenylation domain-containing protein